MWNPSWKVFEILEKLEVFLYGVFAEELDCKEVGIQ
jgi:hypothetical protein